MRNQYIILAERVEIRNNIFSLANVKYYDFNNENYKTINNQI